MLLILKINDLTFVKSNANRFDHPLAPAIKYTKLLEI